MTEPGDEEGQKVGRGWPRPVRTDADREAAMRALTRLRAGGSPGDAAEILEILIADYDRKRWPEGPASVVLRHAMETLGRTQAELGHVLGSRSQASEVLNDRRSLSLAGAEKIERAWGIPASRLRRRPIGPRVRGGSKARLGGGFVGD